MTRCGFCWAPIEECACIRAEERKSLTYDPPSSTFAELDGDSGRFESLRDRAEEADDQERRREQRRPLTPEWIARDLARLRKPSFSRGGR